MPSASFHNPLKCEYRCFHHKWPYRSCSISGTRITLLITVETCWFSFVASHLSKSASVTSCLSVITPTSRLLQCDQMSFDLLYSLLREVIGRCLEQDIRVNVAKGRIREGDHWCLCLPRTSQPVARAPNPNRSLYISYLHLIYTFHLPPPLILAGYIQSLRTPHELSTCQS